MRQGRANHFFRPPSTILRIIVPDDSPAAPTQVQNNRLRKRIAMLRILRSFALTISLGCLWAQSAFDAASIKPSPAETRFFSMNRLPGGRLRATGATLGDLLELAYRIESFQITGGPSWLNSARYDISTTAKGDAVTAEQQRQMIRSLLADLRCSRRGRECASVEEDKDRQAGE